MSKITESELMALTVKADEALDALRPLLKEGDVLTHTACAGCILEHVFAGYEGRWICGYPTRDTMLIEQHEGSAKSHWTNDISPINVTHINRVPIAAVPMLVEKWRVAPYKPKPRKRKANGAV